jgi:hypothetical protein
MTTDNFCFYLQNRLIQASQTGGQWYNDTSPFSIPWLQHLLFLVIISLQAPAALARLEPLTVGSWGLCSTNGQHFNETIFKKLRLRDLNGTHALKM